MKQFIFFILTLCATLTPTMLSCSSARNMQPNCDIDTVGIQIDRRIDTDFLSIDALCLNDTLLWIYSDVSNEPLLYVCNTDGEVLARGINYGNGNNEVLEVSSLHRAKDSNIKVYDSRMGKIYSVNRKDSTLEICPIRESLRLFDDAIAISDSATLALPVVGSYSYYIFDGHLTKTDSLSYYPPKPEGIDDKTHSLACTGLLAYSPSDNTFVRSLAYDGGLDFFSINDGKVSHIKRHSEFDMDYGSIEVNGMILPVPNKNSRVGYSYLCSTPNYYYASFSMSKIDENPDGLANEIHVFDHTGNLVKVLVLDDKIDAFAVSDDDRNLYAVVDDDEKVTINHYKL